MSGIASFRSLSLLLLAAALTPLTGCATLPAEPGGGSAGVAPAPAATGSASTTLVRVSGHPITAGELEAYAARTEQASDVALEDMIDLQLLREAASAKGIPVPEGDFDTEHRTNIEYALSQRLGILIPPGETLVVVDHAWVKDAATKKGRAADRAAMEKLRTLVIGGSSLPEAWPKLGVPGDLWHVGDHEEYPLSVLPPGTESVTDGGVSKVSPGNGGIHLFKIYSRKQTPPRRETFTGELYDRLRQDALIERVDR